MVEQPFLHTGREYDRATGLYYYRARYYDPETGTFTQDDPIHFAAGDLNVSRYVWNNPLNWNDPSGLAAGISYAGQSRSSQAAIAGGSGVRRFTSGLQTARALARPRALQGATRVAGQLACQLFGAASAIDVLGVVDWTVCGAQAAIANESTESKTQTETKASEASDTDDCKQLRHDVSKQKKFMQKNPSKCIEGMGRGQLTRNRDNLLRYVNLREKRDYYCARDDMEGEDQQREELWQAVNKCEDLIQALARN